MNGDVSQVVVSITGPLILAIAGWIFRTVRRYLRALRYLQEDVSTLWVHFDLPREWRSGSYKYPEKQEES